MGNAKDIGIHEDNSFGAEDLLPEKKGVIENPMTGESDVVGDFLDKYPNAKFKPIQLPAEHTGNKYIRQCQDRIHPEKWFFIDVYCVLHAFGVKTAGVQHAIKKLLCAGLRSKGNEMQDLIEARDCLSRAIEMRQAEILKEAEESKT